MSPWLSGIHFYLVFVSRSPVAACFLISQKWIKSSLDNIFIERLWRSVKYEDIYLKDYVTVPALFLGLDQYFTFYNQERPHQSLDYQTPTEVYFANTAAVPKLQQRLL